MADTDVRDLIANALLWEEGSEWAEGTTRHIKDADAILAALAEAGLVVVPAEDVAPISVLRNAECRVDNREAALKAMREDRDTWFEDALICRREMGKEQARANEAEARLQEIGMVKTWTNEDGKSFVFTEDLLAILNPGAALPVTEETRKDDHE